MFCTLFYARETNDIWYTTRVFVWSLFTNYTELQVLQSDWRLLWTTVWDWIWHQHAGFRSVLSQYVVLNVVLFFFLLLWYFCYHCWRSLCLTCVCVIISLWHFSKPSHDVSTGHHNVKGKVSSTIMNSIICFQCMVDSMMSSCLV